MPAHLRISRHNGNELVGEILRVRRHKTDAIDSVHLAHHIKKLGKCDFLFKCLAVGIYVLPEQHDFAYAVRSQLLTLPNDIDRLSADLTSAHIRNNTVCTEVIAPIHNIDAGLKGILALGRQTLRKVRRRLNYFDDPLLFADHTKKEFRELIQIVGTEN